MEEIRMSRFSLKEKNITFTPKLVIFVELNGNLF